MTYEEDRIYIKKVLDGNQSCFALLVEKHKNIAFTLALRITKNREDAEEVAQDAFLKTYRSLGTFKHEARFSTWLYKIVYRTAISKLRKKQIPMIDSEEALMESRTEAEQIDALDDLRSTERKRIISLALGRLNEAEGAILTLYYLDENSIKEIEDITGYSNSNIKILLHRGRKKLLVELKKILKDEIVSIL
jgi:RNA polymerase sigma factor (sigma-70 family)